MCEQVDFLRSSYTYVFPKSQIAQHPVERGSSRLLVLGRSDGSIQHTMFSSVFDFLPREALVVVNNSRVVPARIPFVRSTGGQAEFFLLTPLPILKETACVSCNGVFSARGECLIKPSKSFSVGSKVVFGSDMCFEIVEKKSYGRHEVVLSWSGDLSELFGKYGSVPLPPYIHKKAVVGHGVEHYQTVYSRKNREGSVAASTAGLHFSLDMQEELKGRGFLWEEVTLHVGYGTFSPIRSCDVRNHTMHAEFGELSEGTVASIKRAQKEGRPIVAIGTTTVRILEGVFLLHGDLVPYKGWLNTFIKPGHKFKVIDGLITNFHQPETSLLLLVSAFAGRDVLLGAYAEAISLGYRLFSYGDAMLIC